MKPLVLDRDRVNEKQNEKEKKKRNEEREGANESVLLGIFLASVYV